MFRVRWLLVLLITLSGCTEGDKSPELVLASWTVGPEPTASIGGNDPREDYQLFQVRAAFVLGDGRIIVANAGSSVHGRAGSAGGG